MEDQVRVVTETAIPPCPKCSGTGGTWDPCHVCWGKGTMWVWNEPDQTCIECGGSGLQPCWSCCGTGTVPVRLRNLTPHPVTIVIPGGRSMTIPTDPEGPARCIPTTEVVGKVMVITPDGGDVEFVPVRRTVMGAVTGLPDPEPGVLLLVSRVVAEAARDRKDLVIVDDTVRDDQGRIIGARALAVIP